MSELAVRLAGVRKEYAQFTLGDLDLEVASGRVLGLIGANGAGKSTTIRILLGLVRADRGEVEVLGEPIPQRQAVAKREIGFASEDLRLYKAATIGWHMELMRSIYPGWDPAYADLLLHRFDLRRDRKVKGLSHGQRVKAMLLLALAHRPRLLVLDEPTTGLDPLARQEVLGEMMEALADERRTILFSSQNTLDVEQISDQIAFLDRGRLVAADDKEVFLDRWRRLRLEVPPGVVLPALPGTVSTRGSERLPVITTERFDDGLVAACQRAGAVVQAVETMTLEEIFVAGVTSRRQEVAR